MTAPQRSGSSRTTTSKATPTRGTKRRKEAKLVSDRALSVLVHGHSKVGKTTFAATAPYPRLLLDVEAASRFLPVVKTVWDPSQGPPPAADGTWDTCIVYVRDYNTVT